MPGDYTKLSFHPKNGYSGVLKQQGRVDLDSDFNELVEIDDRRWRSETIDVIDHATVPRTTPDAFSVNLTNDPDSFNIGIGRIYVDGVQVENFGLEPYRYQPDLGELKGTTRIPYVDQPFFPRSLPPILAAAPNTCDLVYLEVWQREVTVWEEPELREVALGGPDTTTRVQTAWQVRTLTFTGQHQCGDEIPEWNRLIAPSAGRLSATTVAPPASVDPCIISPSGGYRGPENRLYRVEIHSAGPIGDATPATFKWSRDNASIASAVLAMPTDHEITIESIGRDRVARFEIGNWIEITDDFREFQFLAGHIAQITGIDEARRTITFQPSIPGAMGFDTSAERHLRVRRWDQSENLNAEGLVPIVPGQIEIEDGIRVEFSLDPAGGEFKIGDYWLFWARTATGKVEPLENAPPHGIVHHYARLGIINWANPIENTIVRDCRRFWPPDFGDSCCTVVVHPGESIQAAIDSLEQTGGCVCLKVGVHRISNTIRIETSNICLHGESSGAVIEGSQLSPLLAVLGRQNVVVSTIEFRAREPDSQGPLILFMRCMRSKLNDCRVIAVQRPSGIAIHLVGCHEIEIHSNTIGFALYGVYTNGNISSLSITDNTIDAGLGPNESDLGNTGIFLVEGSGSYRIERNQISRFLNGIHTGGGIHSTICQNQITRGNLSITSATTAYAIEVVGQGTCSISNNRMNLAAEWHGGIFVSLVRAVWIENNEIECYARRVEQRLAVAISVQETTAFISMNRILLGSSNEFSCLGITLDSAGASTVADNEITGSPAQEPAAGIFFAISVQRSTRTSVRGNVIFGAQIGIAVTEGQSNRVSHNQLHHVAIGISTLKETGIIASDNTVSNARLCGLLGNHLFDTTTVVGNSLLSCTYDSAEDRIGAALSFRDIVGELRIELCEIRDTGISEEGIPNARPVHGISIMNSPLAQILSNHVTYRNLTQPSDPIRQFMRLDHRALFMNSDVGTAQVLDNRVFGPGRTHLIEIDIGRQASKLIFSNNLCDFLFDNEADIISLRSEHSSIMGNNVTSRNPGRAFNFNGVGTAITIMGNITRGAFANLGSSPIPSPVNNFNVIL